MPDPSRWLCACCCSRSCIAIYGLNGGQSWLSGAVSCQPDLVQQENIAQPSCKISNLWHGPVLMAVSHAGERSSITATSPTPKQVTTPSLHHARQPRTAHSELACAFLGDPLCFSVLTNGAVRSCVSLMLFFSRLHAVVGMLRTRTGHDDLQTRGARNRTLRLTQRTQCEQRRSRSGGCVKTLDDRAGRGVSACVGIVTSNSQPY